MPQNRRPTEVSAGGVVVRQSGSGWDVCLVSVKGRWEIPKGHPEKGETAQQTALREISEETGLPAVSLHVIKPLTTSNYAFQSEGKLVFKRVDTFLVTCDDDPPLRHQESEVDDAQWFPVTNAKEVAAFNDTKKLIDEAMESLTERSDR
jgi:8-oxo-dGTP pyrophosphatase MutT (NUDIX family)